MPDAWTKANAASVGLAERKARQGGSPECCQLSRGDLTEELSHLEWLAQTSLL